MKTGIERNVFDSLLTDSDLSAIDRYFARFNIFAAIGAHRAELRHSNFLATLLDPHENHGLGDRFLIDFLVRTTRHAAVDAFSPADVLLADWSGIRVRREWHNIDILLFDPSQGFLCCIENKVGAHEHNDQLARYEATIDKEFPAANYPRRVHLYLTPDGSSASGDKFRPISYRIVLESIEAVSGPDSSISSGVVLVLQHYADLLRRHILEQDELIRLCQQIYRRHKKALEAIWEYGDPDSREQIGTYIHSLLLRDAKAHGLALDDSSKTIIRFADATLDSKSWSRRAFDWTSSSRILLYEFTLKPDRLLLELVLGSGDEKARNLVLEKCSSAPFAARTRIAKFHRLWNETVLSQNDFEMLERDEINMDDLLAKIGRYWTTFLAQKLSSFRTRMTEM